MTNKWYNLAQGNSWPQILKYRDKHVTWNMKYYKIFYHYPIYDRIEMEIYANILVRLFTQIFLWVKDIYMSKNTFK